MGRPRLELHEEICSLLGSRNAYFQPPETVKLKYDCCIYERSRIESQYADDLTYLGFNRYELMLIYTDPDSDIVDRFLRHFQHCSHNRHFTADNLYHDVLILYY